MIELNVTNLVGGNIVITTPSSGGGYDVTFANGVVSSGDYAGFISYWNDYAAIDI